jgi:hypothetical protein
MGDTALAWQLHAEGASSIFGQLSAFEPLLIAIVSFLRVSLGESPDE